MIFHRIGLTASWRADPKLKPLGNTVGMSDQVTLMSILRMVSSLVYGDIGEARCGGTSNGAPVGRSLHLQDACGLPYLRRGQCVTCLSTMGVLSDMFERSAWVTLGRVRSLPKKKRSRGCRWRSRKIRNKRLDYCKCGCRKRRFDIYVCLGTTTSHLGNHKASNCQLRRNHLKGNIIPLND